MTRFQRRFNVLILLALLLALLAGCGSATDTPTTAAPTSAGGSTDGAATPATSGQGGSANLILGGYSTPREAYAALVPVFAEQWKTKSGQTLTVEESYQGS